VYTFVKPLRKVSFVYGGLTKYLLLEPEEITAVLITRDHLYVSVCQLDSVSGVPDTCVAGSGCYTVYSKSGPGFSLYLRYCERNSEDCLRFYIDHERIKQERSSLGC